MREVVSSRNLPNSLAAGSFIIFAIMSFLLPDHNQSEFQIAAIIMGIIGLCMLYRLIFPVNATLTVNTKIITWFHKNKEINISWSEVSHIYQNMEDDSIRLDKEKTKELYIPRVFLKTPHAQKKFLNLLEIARPDLKIEKF